MVIGTILIIDSSNYKSDMVNPTGTNITFESGDFRTLERHMLMEQQSHFSFPTNSSTTNISHGEAQDPVRGSQQR